MEEAEVLTACAELEAFLFQSRALLDVVMGHVVDAFGLARHGRMRKNMFSALMKKVSAEQKDRAQAAECYLERKVFDDGQWGDLVRSMRDRVAHHDRVRPGFDSAETAGTCELDWPTIRGKTFERAAQEFENHSFEIFTDMICPLWERAWIAGPFQDGMWETD